MKTIGNVIWFVFGGVFWALSAFLGGIIWCATIKCLNLLVLF